MTAGTAARLKNGLLSSIGLAAPTYRHSTTKEPA
jgi:hypothetical protein